jgi:hypothetical protein
MATGYDRRQPTRETFAFEPATPAQARPQLSGQSRGAQVVGGESQGGVVAAGPQTDAAPVAAGLGQFVEEFMRPHVQRRQQEEFFKGFAEAQSGVAVEEIAKSHGGFSKVFGPTSYLQGAEFFTAKAKIDEWTTARYAELDTLKKMPPPEFAKLMARTSQEMLTGDPYANQAIQAGLIEASAPLMNAVSKARYSWQQGEAANAYTQSGDKAAGALQAAAVAQAKLSDPSDEDGSAFVAQGQAFLGSLVKPEGMADETYKKSLYSLFKGSMQSGNFYAVKLMRQAGIDKVFSEDELTKLEDAEHKYGNRVLEQFTADDPEFGKLVMEYEQARGDIRAGAQGAKTPMQMAQLVGRLNAHVRARTGIDRDVFDAKELRGEVRSLVDLSVSARQRAQDHVWQIEDREDRQQFEREEDERDDREAAASAGVAWSSGDWNAAFAGGVERKHFEALALRDFRGGKLDGLARAFRVSHEVSNSVKSDILAGVEGSIDEQYGKNFQTAHTRWQSMYRANPGMTAAYYGEWHEKMRTFDTLSRQLGPASAFTRAFGDSARYSAARLDPAVRKTADTAIKDAVADRQPSWWNPWGGPTFNDNAVAVMQNVLRERVAMGMQNSDTQPGVLANEALTAALADGSLQVAAGQAWRAAPGSKPFRNQIGLQQDEADDVFDTLVNDRLKRAGFQAGTSGHLDINYINTPKGDTALHIVGRDDEGHRASVIIGIPDFKAAAANRSRAEVAGNQPSPAAVAAKQAVAAGLDPNRRIKGEKGWQRVKRINLETKARGLPRTTFRNN